MFLGRGDRLPTLCLITAGKARAHNPDPPCFLHFCFPFFECWWWPYWDVQTGPWETHIHYKWQQTLDSIAETTGRFYMETKRVLTGTKKGSSIPSHWWQGIYKGCNSVFTSYHNTCYEIMGFTHIFLRIAGRDFHFHNKWLRNKHYSNEAAFSLIECKENPTL